MTPDEEVRRGHEAKQLLANPLLVEAFDTIVQRLTDIEDQMEATADKVRDARFMRMGLKKVRKYLDQVVIGGKMAAMEIEKQQSFTERMADRARRFVA